MIRRLLDTWFWIRYAFSHILLVWGVAKEIPSSWYTDKKERHCCKIARSGFKLNETWVQSHYDAQFHNPIEFCPWCGMNLGL